ncbi:hypothetical protein IFM89_036354 [Coptis chinensis]|uniref:Uncharacterized protein n=1 Tax=Coptis chinensis TaxID=261450 RepID=A0A835LKR6_9MAGN|nr:hypothetical protein IFM89_036354 [Coptis chinensis]
MCSDSSFVLTIYVDIRLSKDILDGDLVQKLPHVGMAPSQTQDMEQERTPKALQMKVDTSVEKRVWATGMAKDMTDMNKRLQSWLLDLMQSRLSCELGYSTTEKRRKFGASSSGLSGEEHRDLFISCYAVAATASTGGGFAGAVVGGLVFNRFESCRKLISMGKFKTNDFNLNQIDRHVNWF